MRLTSIELHPENSSESVVLSFRDPKGLNPFNVKSITGLDAEEIVPRSYGAAGGSKFYNLFLMKREPVFQIGLNPNYAERKSYSDLRDTLYRLISSSRTGKMQVLFKNEVEVVAAISGFVSKFETTLFEKAQEVQLSLSCDDPLLKALDETVITDLDPVWSVIEDNVSTAPHGFSIVIGVIADIEEITISDPGDSSWAFQVVPAEGFLEGDVLFLSSEQNDKQVYIVRGEDTIHLADLIAFGSVWPVLFPGENTFSFTNSENLIWTTISYFATYWGV